MNDNSTPAMRPGSIRMVAIGWFLVIVAVVAMVMPGGQFGLSPFLLAGVLLLIVGYLRR